jgi:hypothetical protein
MLLFPQWVLRLVLVNSRLSLLTTRDISSIVIAQQQVITLGEHMSTSLALEPYVCRHSTYLTTPRLLTFPSTERRKQLLAGWNAKARPEERLFIFQTGQTTRGKSH